MSDDTIRTLMGVEADYIVTAFNRAAERHGSVDAYLAAVIGVDVSMRDALRAAYLEA
jgi:protein tyrosine/serine phosphatase